MSFDHTPMRNHEVNLSQNKKSLVMIRPIHCVDMVITTDNQMTRFAYLTRGHLLETGIATAGSEGVDT